MKYGKKKVTIRGQLSLDCLSTVNVVNKTVKVVNKTVNVINKTVNVVNKTVNVGLTPNCKCTKPNVH